ncbi:MAG: hypothetical protein IM613_14550 [Cytophagales bacterium]|nr:hypothetical protein [Cytophagales bacterium]
MAAINPDYGERHINMKWIGSIVLILTMTTLLRGQHFDTLKNANFLKIENAPPQIRDLPKSKLPDGSNSAYLVIRPQDDNYIASVLFKINDSLFLSTNKVFLKDIDYVCKAPSNQFRNDTITSECNLMKGIFVGQKFLLKNNKLKFLYQFQYDLNEDVYKKGKLAKDADDPLAYCQAYMGAQFYSDIYYRVEETLSWAHKKSLTSYQKKDFEKAAKLMLSIEVDCSLSTEGNVANLFPTEFKRIWGDATLFYLKAKMDKDCVRLSRRLIDLFPDYTEVYLQYADALFNLNDEQYKTAYAKYIELMKRDRQGDKIPTRVTQRL